MSDKGAAAIRMTHDRLVRTCLLAVFGDGHRIFCRRNKVDGITRVREPSPDLPIVHKYLPAEASRVSPTEQDDSLSGTYCRGRGKGKSCGTPGPSITEGESFKRNEISTDVQDLYKLVLRTVTGAVPIRVTVIARGGVGQDLIDNDRLGYTLAQYGDGIVPRIYGYVEPGLIGHTGFRKEGDGDRNFIVALQNEQIPCQWCG